MLKKGRYLYYFIGFASLFIMTLSFWWLYLIYKLSDQLSAVRGNEVSHLLRMLKYEGVSLVVIIICFLFALAIVIINDKKKTNALTEFFASLTHELKTPLASIRLQSEIIQELSESETIDKEQLSELTRRLIEDNIKLENELDNTLQLSRLQRGGNLNIEKVNLKEFLKKIINDYSSQATFNLDNLPNDCFISVDAFALKLIFRNLIQNTINHNRKEKKVITVELGPSDGITIRYYDNGEPFEGEVEKLTKLFYKYNSQKGSGIGLHLISGLLQKMNGKLEIKNEDHLNFYLRFEKA